MRAAEEPAAGEARTRLTLLGAATIAGIAVVVLGGRELAGYMPRVLATIEDLGPWAAVAFIGLYAAATVAWIPGSLLTLASGAIFGLIPGTAYSLAGATLGAGLAFLVARHVARGAVERRLRSSRKLTAIDQAVGRQGRKLVFLLRLSPVFPFNGLNYTLGITPVRFSDYLLASAIGMAPGTFLYVYAGYAAGEVAAGAAGAEKGFAYYALIGVGLLATAAATLLITRAAGRALRQDRGPWTEG